MPSRVIDAATIALDLSASGPVPDVDAVTALIRDVAAAEILPRFTALGPNDVQRKASGELVTIADLETERRLTPILKSMVPGSMIIGEEACADNPSLLDGYDGSCTAWIIDPVDGTKNFVQGRATFAVIVALVAGGDCIAGWIHDPTTGRTAVAEKGSGAWLDGQRMRVADAAPEHELSGVVTLGCFDEPKRSRLRERRHEMGKIEYKRCVGHEYMAMASGLKHFALFSRLMPWDHLAGHLIHAEAGGYSALLDGRPYRPGMLRGGLLSAPNRAVWKHLASFLEQA